MEKYTYEEVTNDFGTMIKRSDGAWIPCDESNSDYQAYLNKDKPQDEASAE